MRCVRCPVWMVLCVLIAAALTGCGDSPPTAEVRAEIEKAMTEGRSGVEARDISLGDWENKDIPGVFNTDWTGKLRLKEDHGFVVAQVDGTNIVKVVAKAGDELEMSGSAHAAKPEGVKDWSCGAAARSEGSGWAKLAEKVGPIQMGYPVITSDGGRTMKFRSGFVASDFFLPLSSFKPYIVEGSEEDKKLGAEMTEKARKAAEAQAARIQAQQEAQAARIRAQQEAEAARQAALKAEAEERQRLAAEKAAADQRQREEEAQRRAEAARIARLSPVLAPFRGGHGAILATDAGPEMGAFLYDVRVDEANFKVTGKGLDLREMPFEEFTFECAAADNNGRAAFSFNRSGADPVALAPIANGLGARGVTLVGLAEADRATLDALSSLGRGLGEAAAADLPVEILDAAAAKTRQMDLRIEALAGTVLYKDRNSPKLAPLFTPTGTRGSVWKAEPLSIRLKEPVRGKGLLIKSANPTDNLVVVVNGVHRAKVGAIAKGGAAIIALPEALDVLDLRLEAVGTASAQSIVMIR